jgi:hypothetical protein
MTVALWRNPDFRWSTTNSATMVHNPIVLVPVQTPRPIDHDGGESQEDMLDRIAAERLTPPSSALRDIARKSMPPQEWWDEDFEGL